MWTSGDRSAKPWMLRYAQFVFEQLQQHPPRNVLVSGAGGAMLSLQQTFSTPGTCVIERCKRSLVAEIRFYLHVAVSHCCKDLHLLEQDLFRTKNPYLGFQLSNQYKQVPTKISSNNASIKAPHSCPHWEHGPPPPHRHGTSHPSPCRFSSCTTGPRN